MEAYKHIIYYLTVLIFYKIIVNDSYKLISQHGKSVNITCLLPPTEHADKLIVFKANDNASFYETVNVTNAGPEVPCYCGDVDKEYKLFLTNYSSNECEGKYRCVFSLNGSETHRHSIDVRVMPKVVTFSYLGHDNKTYYGCNRTKTKEEKSVKLYAKLGGSRIDNRNTGGLSFNSTKESFLLAVPVNRTERVICGMSYQGRTEERVISYTASKN
ncbi:immunoglobulin-like domain protein [Finch poxvirus]|uniref:Immunoglobulin-like domain protein n=2 Tax=unclassified Avipoxvirus TaxID=336487 RepID=A0AAT9UQ41_9POXV|nr:immunoglobulin-like domain protein [Finch poxvirus]UOX38963.1 immunoglobulin-like domain protein [Finch poxvirus]